MTRAPLTDAWLAPDGTLHRCAPYGHVHVARELYDDNPEVRTESERLADEFMGGSGLVPQLGATTSILTAALERLGYIKLATRRGVTDWYYGHTLTHLTGQQMQTLLAVCRERGEPWPSWVDRDTGRVVNP